jgi:hypothetical protein
VEGSTQERRGLFDGLRVPHSGNAVLIAALALLVYWLGIRIIEESLDVTGERSCRLLGGMLGNFLTLFGDLGRAFGRLFDLPADWTPFKAHQWVAFLGWSAAVWAFVAGAVTRIAALKIARDEGLELREALRFGARKWLSNLGSVAFVLIIIGFFYLVTNASVAGGIGRIPYVGGIVLGLLFVLVLVSSFLIVLAAALGLLGFNLAAAAISTEVSDAFEGVSRAWDYLLSRPWHVLLTWLLTGLYLAIVAFLGNLFLDVSVKSLTVGWWGLGDAPRPVLLDEATRQTLKLEPGLEGLKKVYVPGRQDFIYHRVIGKKFRAADDGVITYHQGLEYGIEKYKADLGAYPAALHDLLAPPASAPPGAWKGPYMQALPVDAWGREYGYRTPSRREHTAGYDLFSRGPDIAVESDDIPGREGLGVGQGLPLNIAPIVEQNMTFAARGVSIWLNIARLLLYGYCLAYFLSAQTVVYFILRREVEGEDHSEIVLEEEEQHDDLPLEPAPAPKPVEKPATPPATPPSGTDLPPKV